MYLGFDIYVTAKWYEHGDANATKAKEPAQDFFDSRRM